MIRQLGRRKGEGVANNKFGMIDGLGWKRKEEEVGEPQDIVLQWTSGYITTKLRYMAKEHSCCLS